MAYPRAVIFEACSFLGANFRFHGEFDDMTLRWELDGLAASEGGIQQRCRKLFLFLRDNPEETYDNRLISDLVVEKAASLVYYSGSAPAFEWALERAGFTVEGGQIRRSLPEMLDLPAADDEVHALLDRYRLTVPSGHLDQAINAHGRGEWAAANSQIRSFLESLLDEIAYLLVPNVTRVQNEGETRREALSKLREPFLSVNLLEWGNQGKNLVNGLFKRLHPQGSHPGLSDDEDSTFRLHLVLLMARLFLRRLAARSEMQNR